MTSLPTLQGHGGTLPARYWNEFNALGDHCDQTKGLAVLSFGCSVGDELYTIRSRFPGASIFGCEADLDRLKAARERTRGWANVFASEAPELRRRGPFDVIIANSVLMDSNSPGGVDATAWLDVVSLLDEALRPGGVLQIINSNIAFRLHPCASDYVALRHPRVMGSNFASQFDLDGALLAEGVGGLGRSAHLHRHLARPGWGMLHTTDLDDIHFRKGPVSPSRSPLSPAHLDGEVVASGATSYRCAPAGTGASFVDVDVSWQASSDAVLVSRDARRIWFDGKVAAEGQVTFCLTGADANAYVEAMTSRPITPVTT